MKTETYIKYFKNENDAKDWMLMKNRTSVDKSTRSLKVVVDGPEDNFAVVDFRTAQELGCGYYWEV